jgi:D-alanyl-D-alanine carboxypeptidase/D-alanyl-D-alanine-endopeptidase (penicillin-binding protein 4)
MGRSAIGPGDVLQGDMHLIGGGDTTFGGAAAVAAAFGGEGTAVESLVGALNAASLTHVRGGVVGDGSIFDSELGPPPLNRSPPGTVGALQFNRGIVSQSVSGTQCAGDPAAFAADGLRRALVAAGVAVDGTARAGPTPSGVVRLAAVRSPPLSTLVRLINKTSENLLAETLAKRLGLRASGPGTGAAGVAAALRFARRLGVRARIHTGPGAFPFARVAPR